MATFKLNTNCETKDLQFILKIKTSWYNYPLWPNDTIWRLGQHWLRWWLVVWRYQAITWTNVDLPPLTSETISQEQWLKLVWKLLNNKCNSNLPGANLLSVEIKDMRTGYLPSDIHPGRCLYIGCNPANKEIHHIPIRWILWNIWWLTHWGLDNRFEKKYSSIHSNSTLRPEYSGWTTVKPLI